MKRLRKAEPPDLIAEVIVATIKSLILSGDIDARGKTAEQLRQAMHEWHQKPGHEGPGFKHVIDHTESVWKRAVESEKAGDLHFACMYYAMWAEHRMNQIIVTLAQRRQFSEDIAQTLVRDTGYKAKFLWIHCLLRRKPKKSLLDALVNLAEARNQIVHYKWKGASDDHKDDTKARIKKARAALRHLDKILSQRLLAGSEPELERLKNAIEAYYKKIR